MEADSTVAGDDDVQAVRRWVRLSCTEPGTHLPALDQIAKELRLSPPVVRRCPGAARCRRPGDPP
ncbi:hypothetical protein [Streptomyces brasiliensis]|uniref:hypothetical protein n=1 Tax=Streptomyces brasiliensis TaxID=1954 RepID=UPI0016701D5B|nr:hypothetical protein [Streptomyces brasiliensis]